MRHRVGKIKRSARASNNAPSGIQVRAKQHRRMRVNATPDSKVRPGMRRALVYQAVVYVAAFLRVRACVRCLPRTNLKFVRYARHSRESLSVRNKTLEAGLGLLPNACHGVSEMQGDRGTEC